LSPVPARQSASPRLIQEKEVHVRVERRVWSAILAIATAGFLMGFCAASEVRFVAAGEGYGPAVTFQIVLGDLDADGDLDAVFAHQNDVPSRVLLNDGAGRFTYTDQLLTEQGHGVALGDLDGDGDLDIVIACASVIVGGRFGNAPSRIYLNDGTGRFSEPGLALDDTALSGNLVTLADVDGDGDLDVFIAYLTVPGRQLTSRVYLNDGAARFTESTLDLPFGTLFCDLNGDRLVDAFSKEIGVGYKAWVNRGGGVFDPVWRLEDPAVQYAPFGFAFGDVDGDGDIDVLDTNGTARSSGPVYLLLGNGAGAFERRPLDLGALPAAWPVLADLDGDSDLDASVTCLEQPDRIWLGHGAGGFTDSGLRLGGNEPTKGQAVGDLDGDGDLDLFIPVYGFRGGPAVVWLNETPPP
jgi:hypothetical protein